MNNLFSIEVSARHVHLNQQAVNVLFGNDYCLKIKKELSQPKQFVCFEKVAVVGLKKTLEGVSVLGPVRKEVQVELSKTDARNIGLNACLKESGDLDGSPGCELIGPHGSLKIEKGVIVAKRHIHANEIDAKKINVKNGDLVWVKVLSKGRSLIFGDVVVRVSNDYALAMHIDTDEANAANLDTNAKGEIVIGV